MLPHIVCFVAFFTKRPYLYFVGSLLISFAIGKVESKGIDITIAFSGSFL